RWDDEVAVITGSTSGLGKVTAGLFASEGARVVITGRDQARGAAVVDDISSGGGEVAFVPADLSTEDGCRQLVRGAVERFGRVTVLVNNAVAPEAIAKDTDVASLDAHTLERTLPRNLLGPTRLCKHAVPEMTAAANGSIDNLTPPSR